MLPKEILKKVRLLEISTRKLVNNIFAGEYHTAFKGQGLTFTDFREYVPGDDIRSISWNLTAKTGRPFIKRFEEERELTLILAVDVSASGLFGSKDYLKGEVLVHLAALMAFAAQKNNDRVGLLLFSDEVEHFVPPKKGRAHINRLLRDLLYFKPKSPRTDIKKACEHLSHILTKRATVFIFTDFLDAGFEVPLRLLSKRHEVVGIVIEDQAEKNIPNLGLIDFEDAETGEIVTVDSASKEFKKSYQQKYQQAVKERDDRLRKSHLEIVRVQTDKNFVDPLVQYFGGARHKGRRR